MFVCLTRVLAKEEETPKTSFENEKMKKFWLLAFGLFLREKKSDTPLPSSL